MSFRKPFKAVPIKLGPYYRAKQRKARRRSLLAAVGLLAGASVVGGVLGAGSVALPSITAPTRGDRVSGCTATDGDTIRCGNERIRLVGIDAPELPGHCRKGRHCTPGDPYAATTSLRKAIAGSVHIERVGTDHYGRTIAAVSNNDGDLSCMQLRNRNAIYVARWDNDERIVRTCPYQIRIR
ncbi:thermonuclease family protein [Sphingomonas hankookensis]